ncbi:type ISP restriction/modification enzyme [Nannocystis punicea]|uniref:site-specific DNA-methyltransferase (adenine-specific) n=1 Tax=Nannocystis punicea TaxID=2995304 RepID=A0ABY7GTP1_9BACT|nr:type ISP restriction/modification enzyme [Nannocystis poenicansa]WAS90301.1 hypothetical protein O0S08_29280 [Nannocystis poenicansa]
MPRRTRTRERPEALAAMLAAEVRALQARLTGEAEAEALAQALVAALFVGRGLSAETGDGATLAKARQLARAAGLEREMTALTGPPPDELARLAGRLDALSLTAEDGGEAAAEAFFEPLLAALDPQQRRRRGVFYTPRALVTATVAGVDEVLRVQLGLADGLAATDTWAQVTGEAGAGDCEPFVSILDFACGTGAFVLACVRSIERTMKDRWRRELGASGADDPAVLQRWRAYVPAQLLPRVHAYEPMLAPLVVARLRLADALIRSGYVPSGEEPIGLVRRDALAEPPGRRFTVVVGNPPYASSSSAPAWLVAELRRWKSGLSETKSDLLREEWKFLRLAEWLAEQVPRAVVGLVINRDLLVGIAKRGLRASLQATFPWRRVVDLHGDVRGDVVDENVFAITQGVAIAWLCRGGGAGHEGCSLPGRRADKLARLGEPAGLAGLLRPHAPREPYYRWDMSEETSNRPAEYAGWWALPEIFAVHGSGIQSKNDAVCVGWTAAEVRARVELLARASEAEARRALAIAEDGAWSLAAAQAELRALGPAPERVRRILYRPFDWRWTYMSERSGGFLGRPRAAVMRHMLAGDNLALVYNRQIVGPRVSHFGVTRDPICHGTFYLGNRGQDFLAPLYLCDADGPRRSNLRPEFAAAVRAATGLELGPEALLHYVYAVVHSPTYRARHGAAIREDFARVPIAAGAELALVLIDRGAALVKSHLLETGEVVVGGLAEWTGASGPIEQVTWSEGHVFIDRRKTRGFSGVPAAIWEFEVGGYAPCEKWLKARRGRTLTAEDVAHYRRMVAALRATLALMTDIDAAIAAHGGWPGAFVSGREA